MNPLDVPEWFEQARYDARLLILNFPDVPPVLARDPVALARARAYLMEED